VRELDEKFGINYCIDVLTASKSSRVMQNGHMALRSYGSGKNLPKKMWHGFIRELLQREYLNLEGEYPVLKLCQKGRDLLSGSKGNVAAEKIFLVKPHVVEKPATRPDIRPDMIEQDADDRGLFEALRTLRKTLADAQNYPPYMIFNDSSLKQMAAKRPCTPEDFRKITGVGDKKLEKYGVIFISEIRRFCEKQGSSSQPVKKRPSELVTLEMLDQGMDLDMITITRNLSLNTIYGHIENLILAGENIDIERFVSKEKIQAITSAIFEIGGGALKPIKDRLGDNYSYGEIKLIRAKMKGKTENGTLRNDR
jgi:ATP-dependent DNA helicase RecQ